MAENGELDMWVDFFGRVKSRPVAFYQKCIERLVAEDLYEPSDLAELDAESFVAQLEKANATAGEVAFLKQAVLLAKADSAPSGQLVTPKATPVPRTATLQTGKSIEDDEPVPDVGASVVTVLVPGTEDPATLANRGGLELNWKGTRVTKFREKRIPHVVDESLALPALYLHFLDKQFLPDESFNNALRAGNDNSELHIVLPDSFTGSTAWQLGFPELPDDLGTSLTLTLTFLKVQAEIKVTSAQPQPGGFGPTRNYAVTASPGSWYFGLQTARPKSSISLDKHAFGIPSNADIYLFAQNHISVAHMDSKENAAFQHCIAELPKRQERAYQHLAVFLKVFYEGGFAYNFKDNLGDKGYIPRNVGIAALGVVPAFEGQSGIATGYPYLLEARFLRFADTVPVTIPAISAMSSRHGRYGLCFTRCLFVWESASFDRECVLDFCSVIPHGGFFYVPDTLKKHRRLGGLLYAFGEAKSDLEMPEEVSVSSDTSYGSDARPSKTSPESHDHRVCVVCLEKEAAMACIPCGHRAYCTGCSAAAGLALRTCPVCRGRVERTMQIF